MYCPQCGMQHNDDAFFCAACGLKFAEKETAQEFMAGAVPPVQPASTYCGKAIAGFVLSLVGLFCMGLVLGILGIFFSVKAMRECDQNPALQGRGLAVAGLIISIMDVIGAVFMILYMIMFLSMFMLM